MTHLCLFFLTPLFLLAGCEEKPRSVIGNEYRGIVHIGTSVVIESDSFVIVVPRVYDIKYEVTGLADLVLVRYVNEDGETCRADSIFLPWSCSFRGLTGDFVRISARSLTKSGNVNVHIYVDGCVFKEAWCKGAYCTASASGTL